MKKPVPTLPRKLWIGTYEFGLYVVPLGDAHLDGADGMTITEDTIKEIYIDGSMDARRRLEVVFHEISHAVNWVHDVGDNTAEETIADVNGLAWSQILLDNPRFERWVVYTLARIRRERRVDDPPTVESK